MKTKNSTNNNFESAKDNKKVYEESCVKKNILFHLAFITLDRFFINTSLV